MPVSLISCLIVKQCNHMQATAKHSGNVCETCGEEFQSKYVDIIFIAASFSSFLQISLKHLHNNMKTKKSQNIYIVAGINYISIWGTPVMHR